MKNNKKKNKIIFWLLCLLFLLMALFSGYKLVTLMQEYGEGDRTYDDLEQFVSVPTQPPILPVETQPTAPTQPEKPTETEPSTEPTEAPTDAPTEAPTEAPTQATTKPTQATQPTEPASPYPVVDFKGLSKVNDDIVAWIHMEGPKISYPIVQTDDNDYYLTRLFSGKKNKAGAIFMDYRNSSDFSDRHTIIYGHYLKVGGMFTNLRNYKKASYIKSNPTYVIVTPKGNYTVEIFAAYVSNPEKDPSWQLEFASDDAFEDWVAKTKKKSIFKTGVKVKATDKVITLSTCSYEFDNARFVVVGVLRPEK